MAVWRLPLHSLQRAFLGLVILASLLLAWDSPGQGDAIRLAAQRYQFSLLAWTVENIVRTWQPSTLPPTSVGRQEILYDYFRATRELLEARRQVEQLRAGSSRSEARLAEQRIEEAQADYGRLGLLAERIIEERIAQFLKDEGLSLALPFGKPFPPVAFTFQQAPHVLLISPRDRIELTASILLRQEMDLADVEGLEGAVEGRGVSALVERVGGIATLPILITLRTTLADTVEAAVHEWLHHYLFFRPLGQRYWANAEMTTLNETVADLVAAEVARRLAAPQNDQASTQDTTPEGSAFDAGGVLRETRLRVEELLARGMIEEAESYMEEQRRFMANQGHYIRKLNQAYFAFHETYASSPASLSPIDSQLRILRGRSSSLAGFLRQVARLRSVEELESLVLASEATEPRSWSAAYSTRPSPSPPGPR